MELPWSWWFKTQETCGACPFWGVFQCSKWWPAILFWWCWSCWSLKGEHIANPEQESRKVCCQTCEWRWWDLNKHLFIFCRVSRWYDLYISLLWRGRVALPADVRLTGLMAMPEAIGGVDKVTGNSMIWIGTNFTWNRHLVFGSIFGLSTTASRRCCSNWNVYGPKVRYILSRLRSILCFNRPR